jgi:hypothetical protein
MYIRQTIVLHSLCFVHNFHCIALRRTSCVSCICYKQNGVSSPLVLSGLLRRDEGAMWWWRGMRTPRPHALCCGSCGPRHRYHQTRRLGANQSSSANCRGTKGERKQESCFTKMFVCFMMTVVSYSRPPMSCTHGPTQLCQNLGQTTAISEWAMEQRKIIYWIFTK